MKVLLVAIVSFLTFFSRGVECIQPSKGKAEKDIVPPCEIQVRFDILPDTIQARLRHYPSELMLINKNCQSVLIDVKKIELGIFNFKYGGAEVYWEILDEESNFYRGHLEYARDIGVTFRPNNYDYFRPGDTIIQELPTSYGLYLIPEPGIYAIRAVYNPTERNMHLDYDSMMTFYSNWDTLVVVPSKTFNMLNETIDISRHQTLGWVPDEFRTFEDFEQFIQWGYDSVSEGGAQTIAPDFKLIVRRGGVEYLLKHGFKRKHAKYWRDYYAEIVKNTGSKIAELRLKHMERILELYPEE